MWNFLQFTEPAIVLLHFIKWFNLQEVWIYKLIEIVNFHQLFQYHELKLKNICMMRKRKDEIIYLLLIFCMFERKKKFFRWKYLVNLEKADWSSR